MFKKVILFVLCGIFITIVSHGYEKIPVVEQEDSITCGMYGEIPFKNTYAYDVFDNLGGELKGYDTKGNVLYSLIKRVHTRMCRDKDEFPRYHVEFFINNNILITLGHTDIPFATNIFYNGEKYRVICVDNRR